MDSRCRPRGIILAVDSHGDIKVVVLADQGIGEKTAVATTSWREHSESYSPDGRKIAYISR